MPSNERTWTRDQSCCTVETCPGFDSWAYSSVRRSINLAWACKSGSDLGRKSPPIIKFYSSVFPFLIHSFDNFFECLRCVGHCTKSWDISEKSEKPSRLWSSEPVQTISKHRDFHSVNIPTIHPLSFKWIDFYNTFMSVDRTDTPGPISPLGRPRANKYKKH